MFTPTEKILLPQLRKRFGPGELNEDQKVDHYLVKWLRKCENNLDKAEDALRKCLKFRKDNNLDSVLTWTVPADILAWNVFSLVGHDVDNYPILFQDLGRSQLSKIVENKQQENCQRFNRYMFELGAKEGRGKVTRNNEPVSQVITVVNLKDVSYLGLMKKPVLNLLLESFKDNNDFYPEANKVMYFINAGKMFSLVFPLIKACVSSSFGACMQVHGPPSKWKPVLETHIPPNIISLIDR